MSEPSADPLPPAEPEDDPVFDVLRLCANGLEDEARDTYGDRTVDAAINYMLEEAGL